MYHQSRIPANNGVVLNIFHLIKEVIPSAAGAKMSATFLNAQEVIPAWNALIEMGHPQGKTLIWTDNSIAYGRPNKKIAMQEKQILEHALFLDKM